MVYPFFSIHCAILPLNMLTVVIVGVSCSVIIMIDSVQMFDAWGKPYWMLVLFITRTGLDAVFNYIAFDVLNYTELYSSAGNNIILAIKLTK